MERVLLRLLLSVAVTERFPIHVREVAKAFIYSKSPRRREVYMKTPKGINVQEGY